MSTRSEWLPQLGRAADYSRVRRLLDAGRHPSFIGPAKVEEVANRGGLHLAVVGQSDAALALINARASLIALCVHPDFRGHGLGGEFLAYLSPNWARVIEGTVPWFAARGFTPVGALKQGRKLRTQVMVRSDLIGLAGRLDRALAARVKEPEVAGTATER